MLQVLRVTSPYSKNHGKNARELFAENRSFVFVVDAPLMWWIDVNGLKYGFELSEFTESELCSLPISTNIKAILSLTFQEIVGICEDYHLGSFDCVLPHQWPNHADWVTFCDTLFNIDGIKEIVGGNFNGK